jgi:non-specific serine/threonine protein kinase
VPDFWRISVQASCQPSLPPLAWGLPAELVEGVERVVHLDAADLATAGETLPQNEHRAALARGAAMSGAEAIAFALGESAQPVSRPADTRPGAGHARLTRREQEVAALVARGMSNGQIAAMLIVSARTVETHVQHIMDKLGVSARAQIAAWAATQPPAP